MLFMYDPSHKKPSLNTNGGLDFEIRKSEM